MLFPPRLSGLCLGLVALALGGCATLAPSPNVAISLVEVRPTNASLFETEAEIDLRVTNDSSQTFTLLGSSHELALNGGSVGRGVSDRRVVIPSLGSAIVTVQAHLENLALLHQVRDLQNRPVVAYRLDSRLHVAVGSGEHTVAVTTKGSIDLNEFSTALPASRN